jgi:hypothetical protein
VDDAGARQSTGVQAEGKANAKKTGGSLVDSVLLQRAVEGEHHEIGFCENLILNARDAATSRK